ncbi:hypothetical protein [Amnibacterium kyonggiense]|uniref:Uncharacterized protein n=1 Tax=Amnibacterium kyonggiense TaxID=595671 RepID=A0A4R7FTP2_9MICO|nr:hypothetical protein [Amnibacterium kyonggiense]TDS81089.1 hypothetical protein CLV52_1663 [Amnibacterium kyonggiense]
MLRDLMINTTVQMLLLALGAGMFLGAAVIGTSVTVVRHRSTPGHRWIAVSSGAAWLVAAALAALAVFIGTTTTYAISSN